MAADWRPIFGHDDPYDDQIDGIETTIETADDGGFTVLEGACGTGKTMLALTAGIHLVRDPDSRYERVFALTSVKQQLRQFEADLRTINAALPEDWDPISGLTLVGKADVCPYSRERAAGIDDGNVYDRCETLRDTTRGLSGEGGATTAQNLASRARTQQTGLADSGSSAGGNSGSSGDESGSVGASAATYLETAGEPAPYDTSLPEYDGEEYCPFYAQYLEDLPEDGDGAEALPFDVTETGLLDPEDLVARSVEWGTCPHSMMGAALGEAEVVVGNYYHAFDPVTVASFTGALVDESTFVVCDEAHMLEPRVRDLVSDAVGDGTLRDAETELTRVIQPIEFESGGGQTQGDTADAVRGVLGETAVTVSDLEDARAFVRAVRDEVDRRVRAHLETDHRGWRSHMADLPDVEIPLRDPETPAPDELTEWADDEGYGPSDWTRLEDVAPVVKRALDELDEETRDRAVMAAGRVLGEWYRRDHEGYFREIECERTWNDTEPEGSWRRAYNARLALHNCVPGDAIGDRLAEFGGGVLMSATLAPLSAFETVTGLDRIAEDGRPVEERTYGLAFPEENRESFAVDAPKFTYDNRGPPDEDTHTRQVYADAIAEVAATPGNVLVGMPSYAEAEWAADLLETRVDTPVLLDSASADDVTEALKSEFFAGEPKVLVTSLRGTLTEGVDYRGDRLSAAVVCGVPIINTQSPRTRAVRTAYDRRFGDGFRYALVVPAVRKARQALGRVIRGPHERGIRVLVDERYARGSWDSVRDLLPPAEREEFQPVSPDMLSLGLDRFWNGD